MIHKQQPEYYASGLAMLRKKSRLQYFTYVVKLVVYIVHMYTIQYSYILYLYSILDSEETDPQNWKVISGYKYILLPLQG